MGTPRVDWQLKNVIEDLVTFSFFSCSILSIAGFSSSCLSPCFIRWLPQLWALGLHCTFKVEERGGKKWKKNTCLIYQEGNVVQIFFYVPDGNWITWPSLFARWAEKWVSVKEVSGSCDWFRPVTVMFIQRFYSHLFSAFFDLSLLLWLRLKKGNDYWTGS